MHSKLPPRNERRRICCQLFPSCRCSRGKVRGLQGNLGKSARHSTTARETSKLRPWTGWRRNWLCQTVYSKVRIFFRAWIRLHDWWQHGHDVWGRICNWSYIWKRKKSPQRWQWGDANETRYFPKAFEKSSENNAGKGHSTNGWRGIRVSSFKT